MYKFKVNPIGKPRMTQRDRWKKRPVVLRYHEYKDALREQAHDSGFVVPECNYHIEFYLPMPKSWSKKKRAEMNRKPHQATPDKDNLEKAFLDTLCEEDSYVWDGRVSKYWGEEGMIIVKEIKE